MDATAGHDDAVWLASYRERIVGAHRDVLALAGGERLDVTDRAIVEAFVCGGMEAVPAQGVSYLGLLVGERLAAKYTLPRLARLEGSELRDAIRRELEAIETTSR